MPVGTQITKANIDNNISNFGKQLNALFFQIQQFTVALDATVDATLTTLGYSSGEIATLRSAYRDLDKLRQVYSGSMYVTFGATLNTGVPTANSAGHFGYPFNLFVSQCDDFGY